jgi:small subunit ribosomal protein S5
MTQQSSTTAKKRKSEFQEKLIEVRRVTRVVAGGKRFSFRAAVALGNRKGQVGFGVAKGVDVAAAVAKAKRQAEKNIISVPLKDNRTIPHDVDSKFGAARIRLKSVRPGHGFIAGGPARIILELAGIKDISAKILGQTKNKLTNAIVTIEALKKLKVPSKNQSETKKSE